MKAQFVRKICIVIIVIIYLFPLNLFAGESVIRYENWYDIKSFNNSKIGYYSVKVYPTKYNGEQVYKLEGTFHLNLNFIISKYVFHSTDWVIVDGRGVLNYEIDENDNGKLRFITAKRKDDKLEVNIYHDKGGAIIDKKMFNLADYDYTQFEVRFPISFAKYNIGQVKRSRVFVPSKNIIIDSEVLAKEIKNVSWNGDVKRVLSLEITSKEKDKVISKVTSWMLENGELLFSQEKDYSSTLTTKEKALSTE